VETEAAPVTETEAEQPEPLTEEAAEPAAAPAQAPKKKGGKKK
jgi:hypothetical protein